MDRQQILLAKTLEAARIPLSVRSFDERLILQKAIYLLQSAGISIGYRFRWYLRGPYSTDATAGAFGIVNEGEPAKEELRNWELDESSSAIAAKLQSLLRREGEPLAKQASRLELLASILFLYKTGQAKPNDPDATSRILKKNAKPFGPEEVKSATKELRDHGLLAQT